VEFVVAMAVFGAVLGTSRYVSLGSISAALAFPLTMFFRENIFNVDIQGYHTLIFFAVGTSVLLLYTHRENIKRLIAGTERKI
jgi:glycerol-3-phosphate acyltransferase PlsY